MKLDLTCPNCAHCLKTDEAEAFMSVMGKTETCPSCGHQFEVIRRHFQKHLSPERRQKAMAIKAKAKAMASGETPPTDPAAVNVVNKPKPKPAAPQPPTTKKCPYCAEEIQAAAIKCKHCGEMLVEQAVPSEIEEIAPQRISWITLIGGGFIGLLVLITLFSPKPEKTASDINEHSAYQHCQRKIKTLLKAPQTADFPFSDYQWRLDGETFTVEGYVDAENSFGAKLRNNWVCTATFNGGNELDYRDWSISARMTK